MEIEYDKLLRDKEYAIYLCNLSLKKGLKEGKSFLEEILKFSEVNQLEEAVAWEMYTLGWFSLEELEVNKAIEYNSRAREIFLKHKNEKGIIATYNGLMAAYVIAELWSLGIECGIKAKKVAEKIKDNKSLTTILINMTEIYVHLKQYEKAKEMIEQVEIIGYPLEVVNAIPKYLIYARCELGLEDKEKALFYIEKAYDLAKNEMPSTLGEILKIAGQIYTELNEYVRAEKCFSRAFKYAKKYKKARILNQVVLGWSKLELVNKNYKKVIDRIESIWEQLEQKGVSKELKQASRYLSKAYREIGKYEKALNYLEKYTQVKDQETNDKSQSLAIQLDYQKMQSEANVYKMLYAQTETLSSVGQKITTQLTFTNIAQILVEEVNKLITSDLFEIAVYNKESKEFTSVLCLDNKQLIDLEERKLAPKRIWEECINNKDNIIIKDIELEYSKYFHSYSEYLIENSQLPVPIKGVLRSEITIPLLNKDKIIGVMSAKSYKVNQYSFKELNIIKILGSYIAIALKNANLFREVEYAASYDELTGVLNRREIMKVGKELYSGLIEQGKRIGLIMIDVDEFKQINDLHGHDEGDRILADIAKIIRGSIRENDWVGRYGGEEFIVILPDNDRSILRQVAERIRRNVEIQLLKNNENIKATISLGVANEDNSISSFQELIKQADQALYSAKRTGKNKVVDYQLM